jgi:hypothetical protein
MNIAMPVMPMPVIVHSNSHGHSGPWTESDTNLLIAIWIAFTIIGLIGIGIEYGAYRRRNSRYAGTFVDFLIDIDGTFIGFMSWSLSFIVQIVYAIGLLVYGIYQYITLLQQ